MTDITEQVISSIVARLKTQVSDVNNRVFFEPPQKTVFPYIQFNFNVEALPVKDLDALNYTITFNVYSQRSATGALLEATRIGKKIYDALNNYSLSLSQGNAYYCGYDGFSTAYTAEDGRTISHVSRFKILTIN
jgi:hypothetical protein